MRTYTEEQLNDPNLFSGDEYDAERKESFKRALVFQRQYSEFSIYIDSLNNIKKPRRRRRAK